MVTLEDALKPELPIQPLFFGFAGSPEHGSLLGPLEPDEATGDLPEVGRPDHGGVLPAR